MTITRRGLLLVLSSPSGAGKTTITRRLVAADPMLTLSVSVTTREPRPGEVDGRDYRFVPAARFEEMVAGGELLEHARVFGHAYGTPRAPIEAAISAGRDVVADVDWQGARQLARSVGDDLASVFILPPSRTELEARLRTRAQDSEAVIAQRLAKSSEEMSHWAEYAYVVVNRELDTAVAEVASILAAERMRRERQVGLVGLVSRLSAG